MLVLFPEKSAEGAIEGLQTAFEVVIPSILPFAVFSAAVVYSSLARVIGAVLSPVFNTIFGLHPYGAVALLSGMLGGYPTGCKVVCDMYEEGMITKKEGERMLSYANVGGVVFCLNVCGMTAFSSYQKGIIIYLIHILATLMAACIINKRVSLKINIKEEIYLYKKQKKPLMAIMGKSIASGGMVLVNIVCAFVVFYAVIKAFQVEKIPFLCGFCEMTKGVFFASEKGSLPLGAMYFTFGGLSVFAQTESISEKYGFNLKYFYTAKALSCAIAWAMGIFYTSVSHLGIEGLIFLTVTLIAVISALYLLTKCLFTPWQ
ncbi:MAG: hypothetical protein ACI3XA_01450 [Clostridia bacterium]